MANNWPFSSVTAPTNSSGIIAFPVSPTEVTANAMRIASLFVTNTKNTEQLVTITNHAGAAIISAHPVPANSCLEFESLRLQQFTGLKVSSDVASGVQGQIEWWEGI